MFLEQSLSHYSSIWMRYFQPLNASNCGIGEHRVQNILWWCHNLPSSLHLQNSVIMCGKNNIQQNPGEDTVDGIVEIALSLKCKYHPIAIFACSLLPRDDNWSINRVYNDEINIFATNPNLMASISLITLTRL